jgi:hypothetical protein
MIDLYIIFFGKIFILIQKLLYSNFIIYNSNFIKDQNLIYLRKK